MWYVCHTMGEIFINPVWSKFQWDKITTSLRIFFKLKGLGDYVKLLVGGGDVLLGLGWAVQTEHNFVCKQNINNLSPTLYPVNS